MDIQKRLRALLLALCLGFLAPVSDTARAQSEALFSPVPQGSMAGVTPAQAERLRALQDLPTTATVQRIDVSVDALRSAKTTFNLPDGTKVQAVRQTIREGTGSDFTWNGAIPATGGSAVFLVRGNQVTGQIRNGSRIYDLEPIGDGQHVLIQIDVSKLPPRHPTGQLFKPRSNLNVPLYTPTAEATTPQQVDIFIPYTTSARVADPNIVTHIQQAVADANQAYVNSNAMVVWRLVGTMEVPYVESAKVWTASRNDILSDLTGQAEPLLTVIHSTRDAIGADVVVLVVNKPFACGEAAAIPATAANAFAIVDISCVRTEFTIAHEVGHLFGARHDTFVDSTTTPYADGHGYTDLPPFVGPPVF